MAEFFTSYIWPLIIMVAQSLLLLVLLLVGAVPTWLGRSACCSHSPTF